MVLVQGLPFIFCGTDQAEWSLRDLQTVCGEGTGHTPQRGCFLSLVLDTPRVMLRGGGEPGIEGSPPPPDCNPPGSSWFSSLSAWVSHPPEGPPFIPLRRVYGEDEANHVRLNMMMAAGI